MRRTIALAALVVIGCVPGEPASAADCFTRQDSGRVSYDVFQVSPPPKFVVAADDYLETSHVYPATQYTTVSLGRITEPSPPSASGFKFGKWFLQWANRCVAMKGLTPDAESCRNTTRLKANGYANPIKNAAGDQIRPAFSTYAKANACTMIQTRRVLGDFSGSLSSLADGAGLSLWDGSDRAGLAKLARTVTAGNGNAQTYLVDLCILTAESAAPDAAGIMLDYEVFDDRTPAEVTGFIRDMRDLVRGRGKKLILNTNPLPRRQNGIDASNFHDVLELVDAFIPTISSGATPGNPVMRVPTCSRTVSSIDNYRQQLSVMTDNGKRPLSRNDRAKIVWQFSLHDTGLAEAKQLHDEFKAEGYRGVMIFRNYLKQGGACSRPENQLIACMTMGACDGQFGVGR